MDSTLRARMPSRRPGGSGTRPHAWNPPGRACPESAAVPSADMGHRPAGHPLARRFRGLAGGPLSTVLLHETVHVRRFDLLSQAIAKTACSIFCVPSAAHGSGCANGAANASRRVTMRCLRLGVPAHDYAGQSWTSSARIAGTPVEQCRGHGGYVGLEVRVRALLDRGARSPAARSRAGSAVAVVAAACAILLLPLPP